MHKIKEAVLHILPTLKFTEYLVKVLACCDSVSWILSIYIGSKSDLTNFYIYIFFYFFLNTRNPLSIIIHTCTSAQVTSTTLYLFYPAKFMDVCSFYSHCYTARATERR